MRIARFLVALLVVLLLQTACDRDSVPDTTKFQSADADAKGYTAATAYTIEANAKMAAALPIDDPAEFEAARRGFVARDENLAIVREDGTFIWKPEQYAFVEGDAPATVNPSLWRQEKLNNIDGLFKVTDTIHQVRGYDLSNMTIVEGESGRILIDPMTASETALAAIELVERELGKRPIVAVVFTHSHVDHFGGVDAIMSRAGEGAPMPQIIAPHGFLEESISENVLAGTVMMRRAMYMYGANLPINDRGHVGTGLGKQPAYGTVSIAEPTTIIDHTGQTLTVDGVDFEFQVVPGSEAPAEMTFFFPQQKVWLGAELVSHNLHNLYTLRGAKVRDALKWSNYIQEALDLFGDRAEININSHHWPVWGQAKIRDFLAKQRDVYKYIHDQALRLASHGHTPKEIAEQIALPNSLATTFSNRGYYGTVSHNAKAVYQFYFGWYDSNPAHLDPLPESQSAGRYVEAMGGADAVKERARKAYDQGEYRWAAELLNHAVFADDGDGEARELLARCYDQLGYRAESGPWRDEYLSGALELRKGVQDRVVPAKREKILSHISLDEFFAAIETTLNGPEADGENIVANFNFTDVDEQYVLWIENAVLHHRKGAPDPDADFTVNLTRGFWLQMLNRQVGAKDFLTSDEFRLEGDRLTLLKFLGLLDRPDEQFAIVTP
jgi:alkyl sulfatase BDS1-like metallo-beta-lactamase superfamily hydrolase